VRVVIADDNAAILSRATTALTPACTIVGTASDGAAALEAVGRLRPEVVVLDISMPGMTGFEVATAIRSTRCGSAVVFLTVHDEEAFVLAARAAGGLGYVIKRHLGSDLIQAVMEARAGRTFVSEMP